MRGCGGACVLALSRKHVCPRHCSGGRVYTYTTTAMHQHEYTPPPRVYGHTATAKHDNEFTPLPPSPAGKAASGRFGVWRFFTPLRV